MSEEKITERINLIFDEAKLKALAAVKEHALTVPVVEVEREATVEKHVKADAAAAHLNISERKLRQMVSTGEIPHHNVGGSLRFKLSELDEWSRVKPKLKLAS